MDKPQELIHPRDEIMQTMDRIYRYRMTTTSGGNLSIRDEDDIWISPARVDKGNLSRKDIVCVKADGSVEGLHAPSSEFPFHRAVYEARPDIGAIVHAHPVALVAFSICGQTPDTRLFHQAIYRKHPNVQAIVFAHPVNATAFSVTDSIFDARTIPESYWFLRDVGRVPYGVHYRDDGAIADFVSEASPVAMLENDGVLVTGSSVLDAFDRLEVLESTSEALINAGALGQVAPMSDEVINELRALCNLPPL